VNRADGTGGDVCFCDTDERTENNYGSRCGIDFGQKINRPPFVNISCLHNEWIVDGGKWIMKKLCDNFQRAAPVLFFHAEIDIAAKLDTENVEVRISTLNSRTVLSAEKGDLQRGKAQRVGKKISRRCTVAGECSTGKIRR
jgi:hypothetical protein